MSLFQIRKIKKIVYQHVCENVEVERRLAKKQTLINTRNLVKFIWLGQVCKTCGSRKMLKTFFFAKSDFDGTENEPSRVWKDNY